MRPENLVLPGALTLLAALAATTLAGCGSEAPVRGPAPPVAVEAPAPLPEPPASETAISDTALSEVALAPAPGTGLPLPDLGEEDGAEPSSEGPPPVPTVAVRVRHGESLVLLAGWSGVDAEDLAELNGLDVSAPLHAGQELLLPTDLRSELDILVARDDALDRRLQRYLARRGGAMGVETLRVRTGDTGWSIARDRVGVPLWVVAAYNPDVDLDRLRIGDRLQVPVIPGTVAEAEEAAEVEEVEGGEETAPNEAGPSAPAPVPTSEEIPFEEAFFGE